MEKIKSDNDKTMERFSTLTDDQRRQLIEKVNAHTINDKYGNKRNPAKGEQIRGSCLILEFAEDDFSIIPSFKRFSCIVEANPDYRRDSVGFPKYENPTILEMTIVYPYQSRLFDFVHNRKDEERASVFLISSSEENALVVAGQVELLGSWVTMGADEVYLKLRFVGPHFKGNSVESYIQDRVTKRLHNQYFPFPDFEGSFLLCAAARALGEY